MQASEVAVSEDNPLEHNRQLREVGDGAVWMTSSSKSGNGAAVLRDGNTSTFWQSDGALPHKITIQFRARMALLHVQLYLDYRADESYTPTRLAVRAGSMEHDVRDVRVCEVTHPQGWVTIDLSDRRGEPLYANLLQVVVLVNHQNGRDSRVRQVRVFTARDVVDTSQDLLGLGMAIR